MTNVVKDLAIDGDLVQIHAKTEHLLSNHWKTISSKGLDPRQCTIVLRTNLWMQQQDPFLNFLSVCRGVCLVTSSAITVDRVFVCRKESTIRFAVLDTNGFEWRRTNGALELTAFTQLTELVVRDPDCVGVFAKSPRLEFIRILNALSLNAARFQSLRSLRELDLNVYDNADACEALAQAGSIPTIEKIVFVNACFTFEPRFFYEKKCSRTLKHLTISASTQGTCRSLFEFFATVDTLVVANDVFCKKASPLQDTWRESFRSIRCSHVVFGRPVHLKGKHVIADALVCLDALVQVSSIELYVDDAIPFRVPTFVEHVRLVSHRWTKQMLESALKSICTRLEIVDFGDSFRDDWIDCPPSFELIVSRAPRFTPPNDWWA